MSVQANSPLEYASSATTDQDVFACWKRRLEKIIAVESDTIINTSIKCQIEFCEAASSIHGDYMWFKATKNYHLHTKNILADALQTSFKHIVEHGSCIEAILASELSAQRQKYQEEMSLTAEKNNAQLERAQILSKKEIERINLLERCLRQEESHQTKENYESRLKCLINDHNDKEIELIQIYKDLKASYNALEGLHIQDQEALRECRLQIQRLTKYSPLRKSTSNDKNQHLSPQTQYNTSHTAAKLSNMLDRKGNSSQVVTLKDALIAANETIELMQNQYDNMLQCQQATIIQLAEVSERADNFRSEVEKLNGQLTQTQSQLKQKLTQVDNLCAENTKWEEKYKNLTSCYESLETKRVEQDNKIEGMQTQIYDLECQKTKNNILSNRQQRLEEQFAVWRTMISEDTVLGNDVYHKSGKESCLIRSRLEAAIYEIVNILDNFLLVDNLKETTLEYVVPEMQLDLNTRLENEYERQYVNRLQLRMNEERKEVLKSYEILLNQLHENLHTRSTHREPTTVSRKTNWVDTKMHAQPYNVPLTNRRHYDINKEYGKAFKLRVKVQEAFKQLGASKWGDFDRSLFEKQLKLALDEIRILKSTCKEKDESIDSLKRELEATALLISERELVVQKLVERCNRLKSVANIDQNLKSYQHKRKKASEENSKNTLDASLIINGYHSSKLVPPKSPSRNIHRQQTLAINNRPSTASSAIRKSNSIGRHATEENINSDGRHPHLQLNNIPRQQQIELNEPEEHVQSILKSEFCENACKPQHEQSVIEEESLHTYMRTCNGTGVIGIEGLYHLKQRGNRREKRKCNEFL